MWRLTQNVPRGPRLARAEYWARVGGGPGPGRLQPPGQGRGHRVGRRQLAVQRQPQQVQGKRNLDHLNFQAHQ